MAKTKYTKNKRGEYATQIWDGTYNPDGTKHRKYLVSKKSSADLEQQVRELKQAVENADTFNSSNVTFGEYAEQWLAVSKAATELKTQRMYGTCVNNYLAFLADIQISSLRQAHVQQAINHNLEHPKTCKNIRMTLSQIIRAAVRDRLLPRSAEFDLLTDISLPRYIKPEKRPLTALEKQAFFTADMSPKKTAYVSVLYYLGTRKGEALGLMPEDFDWKNRTVHISRVVVHDGNTPIIKPYPKSERGIRNIPMPEALIPRVRDYVESVDKYLFPSRNHELMTDTAYRRMWESIITSFNVALGWNPNAKKDKKPKLITDLTAHVFRHNYCTNLCYQIPQISTKMIAKILGDDEQMVIKVYSHILSEKEDVASAITSAFL